MDRSSDYYIWLCDIICMDEHGEYSQLIKQLYETEFIWLLRLDGNRAAGGTNLRSRFCFETNTNQEDVPDGPCSVLEMLIGVADHMEDQMTDGVDHWFWNLIENLGLDRFDDRGYDKRGVAYILDVFMNRTFMKDGRGSLFPLRDYPGDCRNIDIWAQMNAWINENYPTENSWLY